MDKEKYEAKRPFAGEKKPSMKRRCIDNDYHERRMYMVTMVTEGRQKYFGEVVGRSNAEPGSQDAPHIELSPLGQAVKDCWFSIPSHYGSVKLIALQMMPDHLHGILFISERMDSTLGDVLHGFKTGCNKCFRRLMPVEYDVAMRQQTERNALTSGQRDRDHGLLFAPNYNDKVLLRDGQLDKWKEYLKDNPRRLLMKREHADLFRVQRDLQWEGMTFSAIGNRFLLDRPVKLQVQCSRHITSEELAEKKERLLSAAAKGAVLVSPSISPGEKEIMRSAFEKGFPLITLQENGFTDLAKPGGQRFDACARGQLLLLAPWEHHNEHIVISRNQCLSLNEMAKKICKEATRQLL